MPRAAVNHMQLGIPRTYGKWLFYRALLKHEARDDFLARANTGARHCLLRDLPYADANWASLCLRSWPRSWAWAVCVETGKGLYRGGSFHRRLECATAVLTGRCHRHDLLGIR